MNNKEILANAPKGWTHHIERGVENVSSKYLKAEPHWRYYVDGKWYLVPEPMIDFSIRSRADIERIVELENNYNEARRICKEVCLAFGHDAEFPALIAICKVL